MTHFFDHTESTLRVWTCSQCVRVHPCVFRSASQLQTVATGKSKSTSLCIFKCVTCCLVRQHLIGLQGINEWRVSDGLEGIWLVCELCACECVCWLRARDTGQPCDMSGWHPVKASWQYAVMLPSGSYSTRFSVLVIHIVSNQMWTPCKLKRSLIGLELTTDYL